MSEYTQINNQMPNGPYEQGPTYGIPGYDGATTRPVSLGLGLRAAADSSGNTSDQLPGVGEQQPIMEIIDRRLPMNGFMLPSTPVGLKARAETDPNYQRSGSSGSNSMGTCSMSSRDSFLRANYTGSSSNESNSCLLSELSIDMMHKNAKNTKDPQMMFSYARVLLKSAILTSKDGDLAAKERGLKEARRILKRLSKAGFADAQYLLGDAYSVGLFNGGKAENSKALAQFEMAGKSKHAEGAYRTAVCYRKGWGCTPDARKVIRFLEIGAMNRHAVAMMEYGIYLFHGLMGLPEDLNTKKRGLSWLRRATECVTTENAGAPYELAIIYLNGFKDIVIKDTAYAIRLLCQATHLEHTKSAVLLGKIYQVGDIVERNADLSIHFYNIAAQRGDPDGMMGLCSWYFVGTEHLPKDHNAAFAWAHSAAEQGNVRAMLLLRRLYALGLGCEKDPAEAAYWSEKATQGDSS